MGTDVVVLLTTAVIVTGATGLVSLAERVRVVLLATWFRSRVPVRGMSAVMPRALAICSVLEKAPEVSCVGVAVRGSLQSVVLSEFAVQVAAPMEKLAGLVVNV